MPRRAKRIIIIAADLLILGAVVWIALSLGPPSWPTAILLAAAIIFGAGRTGIQLLQALPNQPHDLRRLIARATGETGLRRPPEPACRQQRHVSASRLGSFDVENLLGRKPVPPNPVLVARSIRDKSILVTGAGGSVGSEIARQVITQSPRRVVLFDNSEAALYQIEIAAREIVADLYDNAVRPEIVAVLGSVLDARLVGETIRRNCVETIYHAAAYKHVPIVEQNPIVGLGNNTFGASVVADAADAAGVERVVLISTDKAVRPTSIMGASKRLAELILQAKTVEGGSTVFTTVRFGNVLDSSGSVVRLFRKQIRSGGPVTVTHPQVVRYFMSVSEAAQLVIQAGAMATGGEVFVLDMGEPVKIDDLARSMIRLAALEVRDSANPQGDIAIAYTGLRPGEKLYEELLIGPDTSETEHPRILRSHEPFLSPGLLKQELRKLQAAMAVRDVRSVRSVLTHLVEGYRPQAAAEAARDGQGLAYPSATLH